MPIPQLSTKTHSPKNWSKKPLRSRTSRKLPKITGHKPFKKPPKIPTEWLVLAIKGAAILFAGGVILLIGAFIWYGKDLPPPGGIIDREVPLSTKIYDKTGETVLFDIFKNQQRTQIELSDIPDYAIEATIAAEDRDFYTHSGFSVRGIVRTMITNILRNERAGGSTLTQQLIKNAILSPEKKYSRKIKELILAIQLERKFTKDEILRLYFNEIPYGSVAYGIQAASETYFNKQAKDLTLAEAAILAALPQSPTYYSPYGSHYDELIRRQHYVLDAMVDEGYIAKQEAEAAKEQELSFRKREEGNITAPHFVMYVRELLTAKYGERLVEQGGLKVITTLDLSKQEKAEKAIEEGIEKIRNLGGSNAALLSLDPKTGQIEAMVGSVDFFDEEIDGQVNITTRLRQPGSSFKPIVYAAAFKKGYTPGTILYDVVTPFSTDIEGTYKPKNYDLKEHGPVTIRKALAGSLNIPAVKAIYLTGINNVLDLAEDLGYSSLDNRSRFGLSLVLGGGEVRMIEHLNAYAAFAREGIQHEVSAILKVEDKDGNVLEEWEDKNQRVLEEQTARQINNILSDNNARAYAFGENNYLTLGSRPVAAKTGTTNDYRDAWTLGYTPSIAAAVWAGNNNNDAMNLGAAGGAVSAPIWRNYMQLVLGDTPVEYFKEPNPVVTGKAVLDGESSSGPGIPVKIDRFSGKLATQYTPEHLVIEKKFTQAHSILFYINKDDPQGDTPPNTNDPQFANWEGAIQRWLDEQGLTNETQPTEYDDVHLPEYIPSIIIESPTNNSKISSRDINVRVNASAPRGVSRVEYYLEDHLVGTSRLHPYELDTYLGAPAITSGFYTLTAKVFDDVDNTASDQISLNLLLPSLPVTINLTEPASGTAATESDFPLNIAATLSSLGGIKEVTFFFTKTGGAPSFINTTKQVSSSPVKTIWQEIPPPGGYEVYAVALDEQGRRFESRRVNITISKPE